MNDRVINASNREGRTSLVGSALITALSLVSALDVDILTGSTASVGHLDALSNAVESALAYGEDVVDVDALYLVAEMIDALRPIVACEQEARTASRPGSTLIELLDASYQALERLVHTVTHAGPFVAIHYSII